MLLLCAAFIPFNVSIAIFKISFNDKASLLILLLSVSPDIHSIAIKLCLPACPIS